MQCEKCSTELNDENRCCEGGTCCKGCTPGCDKENHSSECTDCGCGTE